MRNLGPIKIIEGPLQTGKALIDCVVGGRRTSQPVATMALTTCGGAANSG